VNVQFGKNCVLSYGNKINVWQLRRYMVTMRLLLLAVQLWKGQWRLRVHCHHCRCALMLRCQNLPWWRSCEHFNNFLSSFWPPAMLEYKLVDTNRVCLASFPAGRRRNGLATSTSSNCFFLCQKLAVQYQSISEHCHMTTVKPNYVMHWNVAVTPIPFREWLLDPTPEVK